jgi:hypothetical protein
MSKRVTTQTEITDLSICMDAFKSAGIQARKQTDSTFEVRMGRSIGLLDLRTGQIEGDDMSFSSADFDVLKQHYAEQKYMWELKKRGASIHHREVDREGNIIIQYQIA